MDLPWSVVEVVGGQLEEDFTNLSDLAGLADVDDFLLSAFLDFFSAGPLKPEVVWLSTTPTTDTSAGSTRVGLRVSNALAGVDDLASSPSACTKGWITGPFALKTKHHSASKQQVVFQYKGLSPFSYRDNAHKQSGGQNLPSCGRSPLDAGWEKT